MHAVFYRNLNLGHPGSPTREQLEGVLLDAGAHRARSFQTNGTVLLVADDPHRCVRDAAEPLARLSGYDGAAMSRSVASLRAVLDADHFAGRTDERTHRETFTFVDAGRRPTWEIPWTNDRDDVDAVHVEDGLVLGVTRRRGSSVGAVNSEVERETGGVATTRTKGTIERLLRVAGTV